jgi:hypothetical protein
MFNNGKEYIQRIRHWLGTIGVDVWKVAPEGEQIRIYKNNRLEDCIALPSIGNIRAFNKDMLTWDEMFLDLESDGRHHLISERYEVFEEVAKYLADKFELNPSDWRQELNRSGAFERITIELWKKG